MKVTKTLFSGTLCLLMLSQSLPAYAGNEGRGALIGTIIGGIIGNNNGRGSAGSTIVGAIIGGAIGAGIAHELDEHDRREVARARRDCLEGRGRSDWRGNSSAYGSINVIQEGYYAGNPSMVCRSYESTIYTRGRTETSRGYACRDGYGNWNEVRETEISYGGGSYGGGHRGPRGPQAPRAPQMPMPPQAPMPPQGRFAALDCVPNAGYSAMLIDRRSNIPQAAYSSMRSCHVALQNRRGSIVCVEGPSRESFALDLRSRQAVGYAYQNIFQCIRRLN